MSYDDGTGYIQVNCNYDFVCSDNSVKWTQRVGVDDVDVGCEDGGGGMIIDAELYDVCEEVQTHMGVTYQVLIDYDVSVCDGVGDGVGNIY
jgi:hypothetical protein